MASVLFAPSVMAGEGKPVAAWSQEEKTARKEIEAAYSRMMSAMARRDIKSVFNDRTKDHVTIDEDGMRIPREEDEKNTATMFKVAEAVRGWNVIQGFTFNGNTATTVVRVGINVVIPPSEGQNRIIYKGTARLVDTWVKRDGKWLLAQSRIIAAYATENGKFLPKQ